MPSFIEDWNQGRKRYETSNKYDQIIPSKGKPCFGGWIFNGFDTTRYTSTGERKEIGSDKFHLDKILSTIEDELFPKLKGISYYDCLPSFVSIKPAAKIEDLNTMAPEIQKLNVPLSYLPSRQPTMFKTWSHSQKDLMSRMNQEYNSLAQYIVENF